MQQSVVVAFTVTEVKALAYRGAWKDPGTQLG